MAHRGLAVGGIVGIAVALAACQPPKEPTRPRPPPVHGGALMVNVNPTNRPSLVGNYDFELLAQGTGAACVRRGSNAVYWVGVPQLAELAADALTRRAIAAAALDAISRLEDADTILLTSVVSEAKSDHEICARISGRGVRLTKAAQTVPAPPREPEKAAGDTDLL